MVAEMSDLKKLLMEFANYVEQGVNYREAAEKYEPRFRQVAEKEEVKKFAEKVLDLAPKDATKGWTGDEITSFFMQVLALEMQFVHRSKR